MKNDNVRSIEEESAERIEKLRGSPLRRLYHAVSDRLNLGVLGRQRLKLLAFVWGYAPLLADKAIPFADRWRLLGRFLKVDWFVPHGHLPAEIAHIASVLAARPARGGECMVEAGCWQGGSSAKFSILCARFGYRLRIYDSFQGVEPVAPGSGEWEGWSGQYASPENVLRDHLQRFGEPDVVSIHPGWFADTLAREPVPDPVALAYIDCDLGKGTKEVLRGVMPALAEGGVVLTQDFHIGPVRDVLTSEDTWRDLGVAYPTIALRKGAYLAQIHWP